MSNQKIPCGGFYLGEGLTLSGGVLSASSKGGIKYVTVNVDGNKATIIPSESDYATAKEVVEAVINHGETIVVKYGSGMLFFAGINFETTQNLGAMFQRTNKLMANNAAKTFAGEIETITFFQNVLGDVANFNRTTFSIQGAT